MSLSFQQAKQIMAALTARVFVLAATVFHSPAVHLPPSKKGKRKGIAMPLGRGSGFGQFFRFSAGFWEFTGSEAYTGEVFVLLI